MYLAFSLFFLEIPMTNHTGMAVPKDNQPHLEQQSAPTTPQGIEHHTSTSPQGMEHYTSTSPLFMSTQHNGTTVAHESSLKMYYVSVEFDNQESNETAIIRWSLPDDFHDRDSEKEVPGMTLVTNEFMFGAVGVPAPIVFEAREKLTGRSVKLNGKPSLTVTPTIAKDTIKVQITIPEG